MLTMQLQPVLAAESASVIRKNCAKPANETSDAQKCFVEKMSSDTTTHPALVWVSYIGVLVTAFVGMLIGRMCIPASKKVPSMILFIAGSVVYIVQEIVFYFIYEEGSKKAMKDGGADQKLEIDIKKKDYDAQLKKMEEYLEITKKAEDTTWTKAGVLTAVGAIYLLAEVFTLMEYKLLTTAEAKYTASFTKATASFLIFSGFATAAQANPYLLPLKASYFTMETAASTALAKPIIPTPAGELPSEGVTGTAAATQVEATMVMAQAKAGLTALGVFQGEFAAATSAAALGAAPKPPVPPDPVAIVAVGLLPKYQAAMVQLSADLEILAGTAQVLANSRQVTNMSCPIPLKAAPPGVVFQELNGKPSQIPNLALGNFIEMIMNKILANANANAADEFPLTSLLKTLGIVAAAAVAFLLVQFTSLKKVADSKLFHPATRAVLMGISTALVGTVAGFTYIAAGDLKKRVAKLQDLIDKLKALKAEVPGTSPDSYGEGNNQFIQQELASELYSEKSSEVNKVCVGSNLQRSPQCKCKASNKCANAKLDFGPSSKFAMGNYPSSFSGDKGDIGRLVDQLSSGDLKQAGVTSSGIAGHSKAFNEIRRKLLDDLSKKDPAFVNGLNKSLDNAMEEFKNSAKMGIHANPSAGSGPGGLGGLGGVSVDDTAALVEQISQNRGRPAASGGAAGGGSGGGEGEEGDLMDLEGDPLGDPNADTKAEEANLEEELKDLKFENQDIHLDNKVSIFAIISGRYQKVSNKYLLTKRKKSPAEAVEQTNSTIEGQGEANPKKDSGTKSEELGL